MATPEVAFKSPSVPLFQRRNFLRRTLTPLWKKRGRGDFWAEWGGNYVANFRDRILIYDPA
jgi:hypothetical protein